MSDGQGSETPGRAGRTEYFQLDEEPSSPKSGEPENTARTEVLAEDADEERRQLELSKVSFQRTLQKQHQVDQSVCSLLQRLDELPDADGVPLEAAPAEEGVANLDAEGEGGQESQKKSALESLAARGMNVMPLRKASPEGSPAAGAPKSLEQGSPEPGVEEPTDATSVPDVPAMPLGHTDKKDDGSVKGTLPSMDVKEPIAALGPKKGVGVEGAETPERDLSLPVRRREASPQGQGSYSPEGDMLPGSSSSSGQKALNSKPSDGSVPLLAGNSFASPEATSKVRPGASPHCLSPEVEDQGFQTPAQNAAPAATPSPSSLRPPASSPGSAVTFASPVAEAFSPPNDRPDSPESISGASPSAMVDDFKTPMADSSEPEHFVMEHSPASSSSATPWTASSASSSKVFATALSPATPMLGAHSIADQSLLTTASKAADNDQWRGWTIQTSQDGKLFYHHIASGTSQWQMPRELAPVLGEWVRVGDEDNKYWRNEILGVSAWKDPRRTTNLFQAALDGNLFFLQLYTEVGGFLDAMDSKGRTALHYNCAGGSTQAVLYLLQNNAAVDVQDRAGSTPLHWSCRYGHAPIVRMLLEAKANPDCQNAMGDTGMHEAASLGLVDPLHWLLHAKANPLLRNRESRTPAEVAARNRHTDVAELLEGQAEGEEPDESEADENALMKRAKRHRSRAKRAAEEAQVDRQGYGYEHSDEEDEEVNHEPSLALVLVRAARPLLRSVQWLANRVLGEKKTNLGASNKFAFDRSSGQWVLHRPEAAPEPEEEELSGASSDEGAQTWSPPDPRRFKRQESEGMA